MGGTESEGGDTQLSDEELYRPAEKDYNRTLTFMCVSPNYYGVDESYQMGSGSVIDDAMYKRDLMMAEKFGVDVIITSGTEKDFSVAATGGAYVCDFFFVLII